MSLYEILVLFVSGICAGFIAGFFGVGGGIIIVPTLIFILGFSQHYAQGTSLAVLLFPVGILAVINYAKEGYVNYKFAAILIVTFILGSYLGSKLAIQLDDKLLRRLFGVLMLVAGIKLVIGK